MDEARRRKLVSAGLLALRLGIGATMLLRHGGPKLLAFSERAQSFADPLGIGSAPSLTLAVFAEFFCSILLLLGAATRLAAVPLLTTMLVAALIVHAGDPFARKELALMFATGYLTLLLAGGGDFSVDAAVARWRRGRR